MPLLFTNQVLPRCDHLQYRMHTARKPYFRIHAARMPHFQCLYLQWDIRTQNVFPSQHFQQKQVASLSSEHGSQHSLFSVQSVTYFKMQNFFRKKIWNSRNEISFSAKFQALFDPSSSSSSSLSSSKILKCIAVQRFELVPLSPACCSQTCSTFKWVFFFLGGGGVCFYFILSCSNWENPWELPFPDESQLKQGCTTQSN